MKSVQNELVCRSQPLRSPAGHSQLSPAGVEARGLDPTIHAGKREGGEEKSVWSEGKREWEGGAAGALAFARPSDPALHPLLPTLFSFSSPCSLLPVVLPSSVSLSLLSFWGVAPSVCVRSHCRSLSHTPENNSSTPHSKTENSWKINNIWPHLSPIWLNSASILRPCKILVLQC